jgi:REP element-mobilizing transposase RayT
MNPRDKPPKDRDFLTYGRSRAVRLEDFDYAADEVIHLVICGERGITLTEPSLAETICENVAYYSKKLQYELYGYCLMPDHMHVLLSPAQSGISIAMWLQQFKSYTTNLQRKVDGSFKLWQRSAYDHVCREHETAEIVLSYIVENPVRRGLVDDWERWPWTRVLIEL